MKRVVAVATYVAVYSVMSVFMVYYYEPLLGWQLWSVFVAGLAGIGFVLARAMLKPRKHREEGEPEKTEPSGKTPTLEGLGLGRGDEAPSVVGGESSRVQGPTRQIVPYNTADSVAVVERLTQNSVEMAKRITDDSIEAANKLQENSMQMALKAAGADPSKWDGGEVSGSLPGAAYRFTKGRPVERKTEEQEESEETSPFGPMVPTQEG